MRDKEYKIFAQRLSDNNLAWLKKEKKKFKSWNLLFNELIKIYGLNEKYLNSIGLSKKDS